METSPLQSQLPSVSFLLFHLPGVVTKLGLLLCSQNTGKICCLIWENCHSPHSESQGPAVYVTARDRRGKKAEQMEEASQWSEPVHRT